MCLSIKTSMWTWSMRIWPCFMFSGGADSSLCSGIDWAHVYGVSLGSSITMAVHGLAQQFQLFQESGGRVVFFCFIAELLLLQTTKREKEIVLFVWKKQLSYIFSVPLCWQNFVRSVLKWGWVWIHSWISTYCLILYYRKDILELPSHHHAVISYIVGIFNWNSQEKQTVFEANGSFYHCKSHTAEHQVLE